MSEEKVFTLNNVVANQQIMYRHLKGMSDQITNTNRQIAVLMDRIASLDKKHDELFEQLGKKPIQGERTVDDSVEKHILAVLTERGGLTANEIGKELNISRPRACNILNSISFRKIRKKRMGKKVVYMAV